MKMLATIYHEAIVKLKPLFGEREAAAMMDILLEDYLGISRLDRLSNRLQYLNLEQRDKLRSGVQRLMAHEPVQHIVGFTQFYGLVLSVSKDTLVPRPETEELVHLIIQENRREHLRVLDIGTGTGCIALSLTQALPLAEVFAMDISSEALAIAQKNAQNLNLEVSFFHCDVLSEPLPQHCLDVVVSNPPYIPYAEKPQMDKNVVDFDPDQALFVPDHDPLLFYRVIGAKALQALNVGGRLYFEIHENYGKETVNLLQNMGYSQVSLCTDLQGKNRMIRCIKGK